MTTINIDGIPVFEALVTDAETGMFKISLVDDPAVMSDFMAFDKQRRPQMYSVQDEEKRLVRGVVMRADFPIYRYSAGIGEYYVIYKAQTIRDMAEKYLAESRQNDVNLMHEEGSDVEGVQLVQWFIKGDGVSVEGFDDIADGSLFAEFHIVNDEIWEAVKAGTYKGFSLEGVFDMVPEKDVEKVEAIEENTENFQSQTNTEMKKINSVKQLLVRLLAEFGNVSTDRGVLAWDGDEDLKEGDLVYVEDAEGNRTPAEDGEYVTADAKTIVVAEGKVAEIRDPEAEVAPEEPVQEEEQRMGRVETDGGALIWEGENDLEEGREVFVEGEEGLAPAPDGEYRTEDGKVIVVVEGRVSEIRDAEAEVAPEETPAEEELRAETEHLRSQIADLKKQLAELKRQPAAKPAHEEVVTASAMPKTGNKGIDRLARYFNK
jgi:hypothetical protein